MKWARIAVDAPVLATPIGIDAGGKANIWAVVVSNNRAAAVFEKLRAREGIFPGIPVGVRFQPDLFEAIRRIFRHAAMGCG